MKSVVSELNSLKEKPKTLFKYLYDLIDKQSTVSSDVKTFFISKDIFELSKAALEEGCDIYKVEIVVDKM